MTETAEAEVSSVLEKLYQLAKEEGSLLRDLRNEFSEIKNELESIKAFPKDADRRARDEGGETSEGIKTWVKHLREASFDIEDVIDEYIMDVAHHEVNHHLPRIAPFQKLAYIIRTLMSRRRIASQIKDLVSSVQRIKERSERYNFQSVEDGSSSNSTRANDVKWTRMASNFIGETEVVGFESPRDELIDYLTQRTKERSLISVVGMGGLGKTTLAKHVFDNQQVKAHFHCRSFITVSQSYSVRELLIDMIKNFCKDANERHPEGLHEMDDDTLIEEIKQYLESKKYLVLFDDVWKESFSDEIQLALPNNNKEGRIIITTRNMDVAQYCKKSFPIHHVHELQHLPENKAWELFCKKVFRSEQCPTDLEDMSKQIVQKCGGLPLAIVAIGGLLSTKELLEFELRNRLHVYV